MIKGKKGDIWYGYIIMIILGIIGILFVLWIFRGSFSPLSSKLLALLNQTT